ncbi:TPA: hypothetical protein GRR81_25190 [Vibrio parahaemolyticus]|nr:hypothetical protein [Vibrio parahaemolyticus]
MINNQEFIKMNRDFHETLQKLLSRKNKARCMYPCCGNKSVKSHTISKQSSLLAISEEGKLITPKSKRNDVESIKEIRFEDIGINEATTFKGFCEEHEKVFFDIDKRGIQTLRDVFSQIYRSACKEMFIYNAFMKSEEKASGKCFFYNFDWEERKEINTGKVIDMFYDLLQDFPEADKKLNIGRNSFIFSPFSEVSDVNLEVLVKKVDFHCPVVLQNKLTLKLDDSVFDSFFIVISEGQETTIIAISHPSHMNEIHNRLLRNIDALNFIESIMMNDGDWFISPSVVTSWSDVKKELIEQDYRFINERRLFDEYDISLFDEVRRVLCQSLDSECRDHELKKINSLPTRQDFEAREYALNQNMLFDISRKFNT